jgi:hypothetical protein
MKQQRLTIAKPPVDDSTGLPYKDLRTPPLRVVLPHSGGSGDSALHEAYAAKHRHQFDTDSYTVLYLDCRNEEKTGGWWGGWHDIKKNPDIANSAIYDFPWESIVKNAAYPVFTNADTDHTYPDYKNTTGKDQNGQFNAYFRWQNGADSADRFELELRLVRPDELGKTTDIPAASTADVTLPRLQAFKTEKGKSYRWQMTRGGKTTQSGKVTADEKGVLTISKVKVEAAPAVLVIK